LWVEVYDEKYRLNLRKGKNYEKVLNKVDPLVKKFAKEYHGKFRYLTFDELCQEIRILVIEGIQNYDKDKKTKFSTFLHYHLNNKLISLIRADRKQGNNASSITSKGLNKEIPLYGLGKRRWSRDQDSMGIEGMFPESGALYISSGFDTFKKLRFRQSVLSVLEKKEKKYPIEVDAITKILLYDETIKEIAKFHELSGWAISMRIKNFGKRYLKDLLIPDNSGVECQPPPRKRVGGFSFNSFS
jgi:hypothetical protein